MKSNSVLRWFLAVVSVAFFALAIYCLANADEQEPAICCIVGQSKVYLGPNGMWCAYYWQDFDLDNVADVVSKYCYNPESGLLELMGRVELEDQDGGAD